MSEAEDVSMVVEFKVWLVRALEDHILKELAAAAKDQGRRLPAVTRTLVRTGATSAVAELPPSELQRFTAGESWKDALGVAVTSGAWTRLVEDAIRHSFAPEAS